MRRAVTATTLAAAMCVAGCGGTSTTADATSDASLDFGETTVDQAASNEADDPAEGTADGTAEAEGTADTETTSEPVGEAAPVEQAGPVDEAIVAVVDEWYRVSSECNQDPVGCNIDEQFDGVVVVPSPFRELTIEMLMIRRDTGLVARPIVDGDVTDDVSILSVEAAADDSGTEVVTCVRDRFADYIDAGGTSTLIEGSDTPVYRRERIRLRLDAGGAWRVWDVRLIDELPASGSDDVCETAQ